jgi:hypothetical protein
MTWQREQKKDARISFFPNKAVKSFEIDKPMSERVLKSRERRSGGGEGR